MCEFYNVVEHLVCWLDLIGSPSTDNGVHDTEKFLLNTQVTEPTNMLQPHTAYPWIVDQYLINWETEFMEQVSGASNISYRKSFLLIMSHFYTLSADTKRFETTYGGYPQEHTFTIINISLEI